MDIARAWGHINKQVIQVVPAGLAQQLLKRLRGHGASPDHGLALIDKKPKRIHLKPMRHKWLHGFTVT